MSAFKDKALPFIKSYGLMIGLGVVAIAALPTAFWFAQEMNASFAADMQTQVSADYDAVSKIDVSYSIPGMTGGTVLEKKAPYNAELLHWYAERWKEIKEKTGVVWEKGLTFNKSDHALAVQGVFPAPQDLEKDVKIRELIGAVIEFHKKLLVNAKAGSPPDLNQLAAQVAEYRANYIERIKAQGASGELDAAEKEKLGRELVDVRVDRCRRRAAELNVFGDMSIFDGVPTEVPTKAPTLAQAWELQERSWIDSDVIRAVALANQSTQNGVAGSLVKRINRISVRPPAYDPANPTPQPKDAEEEKAPTDPSHRISGRISGPGTKNKWYDVRDIDLDIIVASQRLPELIDALAATNFMTVLDLELSAISPREELRSGYYFGDEHVVRARLSIELVMLREWRKDWMPDEVKKALGMIDSGVPAADPNAGNAPPRGGAPTGGPGGGRGPQGGGRGRTN